MPEGILATAYEAFGRGDNEPLLGLLGPGFEWVEPELEGYPLAGVHRGPDAVEQGVLLPLRDLFDELSVTVAEVVDADDRSIVTGTLSGRPAGSDTAWELQFAHVWEIDDDGVAARVRTYFDRSRLTLAASRRQLADVADDLLEQAAEIRRQWAQLADAVRAAGVDDERPGLVDDEGEPVEPATASARLAAVDLAQDGATREEVDAFLRDELNIEDRDSVLDEVFGALEDAEVEPSERTAAIEAGRLSKLFARNRS